MVSKIHMPITYEGTSPHVAVTPAKGTSGFTLIESMVAAVVLTVALVGLLGMQTVSMGRNVTSNDMSRVTNLGSDIIERIQFNRKRAAEYNGITVSSTGNCPTSGMSTMSLGDCTQWRQLLIASGLSGVQGQVTATTVTSLTPSLNQTQIAVTINWVEADKGGGVKGGSKSVRMNAVIAPE
jgi:type IV pilus assembly protein PilV